jgi:hypothetical protein
MGSHHLASQIKSASRRRRKRAGRGRQGKKERSENTIKKDKRITDKLPIGRARRLG